MIEVKAVLKEWGNSLGVIVSKEKVGKEKLKAGDEVSLFIFPKKSHLREFFGITKFSKPIEKLLKEADEEMWHD